MASRVRTHPKVEVKVAGRRECVGYRIVCVSRLVCVYGVTVYPKASYLLKLAMQRQAQRGLCVCVEAARAGCVERERRGSEGWVCVQSV